MNKLTPVIKGNTWDGMTVQVLINELPLDLTGTSISCQFREGSSKGKKALEVTTASGINITDATQGQFEVLPTILDLKPANYYWEIKFTFPDGRIKSYANGTLRVKQDIDD